MLDIAPSQQAATWLGTFGRALEAGDIEAATHLFVDDCYWRDLLTFTWNIKTVDGQPAVREMLKATLSSTQPSHWRLSGESSVADGVIEAWFSFETAVARGEGILRLKDGRCRTLFTAMSELKGFEEQKGPARPLGIRHKADPERETWAEARAREARELGVHEQPYCLVIGGGQGGIMLGARLRQLGVPTLIVEKNARAGDSWRNRYRSLVLHDPVWYDHLPYIPFPENWPVFTPK
ncbi:MAG: NAD(P)/FAD-dependent oxidoreductase, partial [Mesorhizobium sp.]